MSDKNQPKQPEIVKAVMYAVVASAWASLICSHTQGVAHFLRQFKDIQCTLDSWISLGKNGYALMSIGTFTFLTLYFHDEWKYCNNEDYPKENPTVLCIGWTLFLFQVCLIRASLFASAFLGVLGTAIITIGLFCIRTKTARTWWYIVENLIWIISLGIYLKWNEKVGVLLLSPMLVYTGYVLFVSGRLAVKCIWRFKTKNEKGGDNNERNNRNDA